jgi:hypothetical protein
MRVFLPSDYFTFIYKRLVSPSMWTELEKNVVGELYILAILEPILGLPVATPAL